MPTNPGSPYEEYDRHIQKVRVDDRTKPRMGRNDFRTMSWLEVKRGFMRIFRNHGFSGLIKYCERKSKNELLLVVRISEHQKTVDEYKQALLSEPVFQSVDYTPQKLNYREKKQDPMTNLTHTSDEVYSKYAFTVTKTDEFQDTHFYSEYQPLVFEVIPGIGDTYAQRLYDAGFPSPYYVTEDDISEIREMNGIPDRLLSGICEASDIPDVTT